MSTMQPQTGRGTQGQHMTGLAAKRHAEHISAGTRAPLTFGGTDRCSDSGPVNTTRQAGGRHVLC